VLYDKQRIESLLEAECFEIDSDLRAHPNKKIALCYSGGIDSFTAFHFLRDRYGVERLRLVWFDLKSRYSEREWEWIQRQDLRSNISIQVDRSLDLSDREVGEKAYIPFRNMLIAAQAVKYGDIVCMAGVLDDVVADKNKPIFEEMSHVLSMMEKRPLRVWSPFWGLRKHEVVAWFLNNTEHPRNILDTISCYSGHCDSNYCGECPCCFRKWVALRANDVIIDFINMKLLEEYYTLCRDGHYDTERNRSTIEVIDEYRRELKFRKESE